MLCADRIDYGLREMDLKLAKKCFENLKVMNNRIVFKDKLSAKVFAESFLNSQINHCCQWLF